MEGRVIARTSLSPYRST